MKITTEDCVAELNKKFPGNWKRKSKSGNAAIGIRRVFENGGETATVLEKDGVLSIESNLQANVPIPVEVTKPVEAPKPVEIPEPAPKVEQPTNNVITDEAVVNFAKRCFGEPIVFDYKVIAAAIRLRAILPPSFATTAMVKALKGTSKAKAGQNDPAFGIVAGMPRYTQQGLWNLVGAIHELLEAGDVMEKENLIVKDEDADIPVYITECDDSMHKVNKEYAFAVSKVFEDCAEKYGMKAPEPERKKTNNTKPDEISERLKKAGIWATAEKQAKKLLDDFREEHKGEEWEDAWSKTDFHSRSFKDDILTMSFYIYIKRDRFGGFTGGIKRRLDPKEWEWEGKAPVLTSRWKEDGTLIDWKVEIVNFKPW